MFGDHLKVLVKFIYYLRILGCHNEILKSVVFVLGCPLFLRSFVERGRTNTKVLIRTLVDNGHERMGLHYKIHLVAFHLDKVKNECTLKKKEFLLFLLDQKVGLHFTFHISHFTVDAKRNRGVV